MFGIYEVLRSDKSRRVDAGELHYSECFRWYRRELILQSRFVPTAVLTVEQPRCEPVLF